MRGRSSAAPTTWMSDAGITTCSTTPGGAGLRPLARIERQFTAVLLVRFSDLPI
jgi:hypothetical protein